VKGEGDEWVRQTGLTLIKIQTEKDYQYVDRLLVKGMVKKPDVVAAKFTLPSGRASSAATTNTHNFNYRGYLENQNIFAIINTSEKNVTLLAYNYKVNPILRCAYLVREKIKNQFLKKMPLDTGAFMRAILLGDRSELPNHLQASFKNSGTMHILPTQCREKYNYSLKSNLTL
jgi:competence protein ComEC